MKQVLLHRISMLRFRRWSRKAYAVFCSLGKHVTIGCVSKGIAEASLSKTVCLHIGTLFLQKRNREDWNLLDEERLICWQELILCEMPYLCNDDAETCGILNRRKELVAVMRACWV